MRRICLSIVAVALLAVLVFPTSGWSAEAPCGSELSSVQKKVDALVKQWEVEAARFAALADCEKKAIATQVGSVTSRCPVGRRVGPTFAHMSEALAVLAAAEAECAKSDAGTACCEKLEVIVAARRQILASSSKLARYAAAMLSGGECGEKKGGLVALSSSCAKEACAKDDCAKGDCAKATLAATEKKSFCAKSLAAEIRGTKCDKAAAKLLASKVEGLKCEKKATALVAAIKKAGCDKSAAEVLTSSASACEKTACLTSLSARSKALLAAWKTAPAEFEGQSVGERGDLTAAREKLLERYPNVKLVPESLVALSEAIAALAEIDAFLGAQLASDEKLAKSVPADIKASFAQQAQVIADLNAILTEADSVLSAIREAAAQQTEKAAKK